MPLNKEKMFYQLRSPDAFSGGHKWTDWTYGHHAITQMWNSLSRDRFDEINKMLRNNKHYLKDKLGKQSFTWLDSGNRKLWCWRIELAQDKNLWIFTANEFGTSYEVDFDFNKEENFKLITDELRKIFKLKIL